MSPAAAKPQLGPAPSIPLELVEWKIDSDPQLRDGVNLCRFVPYIDGRDVARLFDEWVGPANWSDGQHGGGYDEGTVAGENGMWCSIAVRAPGSDEWLVKTDFGRPSSFEKGKGLVSDAFKRCAIIKWGVGRNVYDLPNVTAPVNVWTPKGTDRDGNPKKTKAFVNDATLPHILAELHRKGFEDVKGGRVEAHDDIGHQEEVEDDVSPQADRPSSASSPAQAARRNRQQRVPDGGGSKDPTSLAGWREHIAAKLNAVTPDEAKVKAKNAFMTKFGKPAELKARQVQEANALADALVAGAASGITHEPPANPEFDVDEPEQTDAAKVHLGHQAKAAYDIAQMDNDELTGTLEAVGVPVAEQPADRADAEKALGEIFASQLDELFPAGATQDEYLQWWNGDPDEGDG